MYGLVNIAVRDLIVRDHGNAVWQAIVQRAAPVPADFVGMQTYADDITYRLVGAASEELRVPAPTLLHAFGRYWVESVAPVHYRDVFDLMGRSLFEFLGNLNRMHDRILAVMPELEPPVFQCERQSDGALRLRYESHRPALAPMVKGLVEGLAERFGESVSIEQVAQRDPERGVADVFLIRRRAAVPVGTA